MYDCAYVCMDVGMCLCTNACTYVLYICTYIQYRRKFHSCVLSLCLKVMCVATSPYQNTRMNYRCAVLTCSPSIILSMYLHSRSKLTTLTMQSSTSCKHLKKLKERVSAYSLSIQFETYPLFYSLRV